MAKKKKIKIPKSVLELSMSPKKFAKKHNIRLKGKGMSKKEKKHNAKRLQKEYASAAIDGMNKAVKILSENTKVENKKMLKVKDGVDNIITNSNVMKLIAKMYKKNPDNYPNMKLLPEYIMYTVEYYRSDAISDEEKVIAESIDSTALIEFCERILKKEIKKYHKMGLEDEVAFRLATVVPTSKLFKNNRAAYRKLIDIMFTMAETTDIDADEIIKCVLKLNKKKYINKKDFLEGFYSEFILRKSSNKTAKYTEQQKDLLDKLIENALEYLNGISERKLRDILKNYIKRRKTAEEYKKDTKRVIKFTDHANSNSPYEHIKDVVQKLIEDNSSNEAYLG